MLTMMRTTTVLLFFALLTAGLTAGQTVTDGATPSFPSWCQDCYRVHITPSGPMASMEMGIDQDGDFVILDGRLFTNLQKSADSHLRPEDQFAMSGDWYIHRDAKIDVTALAEFDAAYQSHRAKLAARNTNPATTIAKVTPKTTNNPTATRTAPSTTANQPTATTRRNKTARVTTPAPTTKTVKTSKGKKTQEAVCRTADGSPIEPETVTPELYDVLCNGGMLGAMSTMAGMEEARRQKEAQASIPLVFYDQEKIKRKERMEKFSIMLTAILAPGLIAAGFCLWMAFYKYRKMPSKRWDTSWLQIQNLPYNTGQASDGFGKTGTGGVTAVPPAENPALTAGSTQVNPFASPTFITASYTGPLPEPTSEQGFHPNLFRREVLELLKQVVGEECDATYESALPTSGYSPDLVIAVLRKDARKAEEVLRNLVNSINFNLDFRKCDVWGPDDDTVIQFYRLGGAKRVKDGPVMAKVACQEPATADAPMAAVIPITARAAGIA